MKCVAIAVLSGGVLMGGCAEDGGYVTTEETLLEPGEVHALGGGCTAVTHGMVSETGAGTAGSEGPWRITLRIEGVDDGVRVTAKAGDSVVERQFDKSWLRVAGPPEILDVRVDDQRTYRVRLSGGTPCNM